MVESAPDGDGNGKKKEWSLMERTPDMTQIGIEE